MTPAERDEVRRRASDRLADHSMATVTSDERCACDRCDDDRAVLRYVPPGDAADSSIVPYPGRLFDGNDRPGDVLEPMEGFDAQPAPRHGHHQRGTMSDTDAQYTQFYDERGNGPDVIRMDVEPMPTVIDRNCHLVFARSEDDDFHATRFVPGGYRLDDRSSQWLMGRLMLWMSGQLVFTGYKDAARNLPGPIDVDGIVASVPDALRVELRDALTAAIDAPRLAARLKPEVTP